ncbi:MAG: extracellular solute-binding protein [Oscillospiraceae bacterium]|jgi:arabinogalactan oligomer/maltooligosaccharide transport system substrate-binding protein|nr:extracellular solute-binding protein [Oscillospiraceae bacterium]MCI2035309.1 extracellular solute-binding protein [Oscillospiraceae bacterium]
MKNRSKIMPVLLAACLTFPSLAGCQNAAPTASSVSSGVAKKEPVTITIWDEAEDGIIKPLQAELNKLAPDITVQFQRKQNMSDSLKLAGNDPSSAPDMYLMAHDKTGTFAQMGILAPVTDFIEKSELSDLIPMTVKAATYQGKVYQLPVYFETQMLIYNKKLMKSVPTTTDDWLTYMKANTKGGTYALVEQHSTAYYAAAWMHSFGATIIDDKGKPQLNTQAMKDAVTYHKQFVAYEPADGEYNTDTALFLAGKAQAIIQGPWFIPAVKNAGIDYGVAALPTVNSTGKPLMPYSGVQGVYVLKNSESAKKDAITKVLRQLLKPEVGIFLADAADEAPANNKCYDDSTVSANKNLMNMRRTAETAVPMQNVPEMDVMWTVTENALSSINKNHKEVGTQLEDAQKKALDGIAAMK